MSEIRCKLEAEHDQLVEKDDQLETKHDELVEKKSICSSLCHSCTTRSNW